MDSSPSSEGESQRSQAVSSSPIEPVMEDEFVENTSSGFAIQQPIPNRLRSICAQYEFVEESVFWHLEQRVDTSAFLKYVHSFLYWYRRLPPEVIEELKTSGVFDEFESDFVHHMCVGEAEGVQSKDIAERIRRQSRSSMNDPKEQITFNIYQAIEATKSETTTNGILKNGYRISPELVDKWHKLLLDGVDKKNGGVRRFLADHDVGAGIHQYPSGDQVALKWVEFVETFCEMVPEETSGSTTRAEDNEAPTENDVETIIKWASWSLVVSLGLHPYSDGNGRLCRLLCNYALSSIFPFDIPIYNVIDPYTSREDYATTLMTCRQCPCKEGKPCLGAKEIIDTVQPGLMATMVLESCAFACQKFIERLSNKQQVADLMAHVGLDEFSAAFPIVVDIAKANSEQLRMQKEAARDAQSGGVRLFQKTIEDDKKSNEIRLILNGRALHNDGESGLEKNAQLIMRLPRTYNGSNIDYVFKDDNGNEFKGNGLVFGDNFTIKLDEQMFDRARGVSLEATIRKDCLVDVRILHQFTVVADKYMDLDEGTANEQTESLDAATDSKVENNVKFENMEIVDSYGAMFDD